VKNSDSNEEIQIEEKERYNEKKMVKSQEQSHLASPLLVKAFFLTVVFEEAPQ
jgi:hypothetical protein